jgi:hypothetical protein
MARISCKKCGAAPASPVHVPTSRAFDYVAGWLSGWETKVDTLSVAEAKKSTNLVDFLRSGGSVVLHDERRGREAKVTVMSPTGFFLVLAPQASTGSFEDRLLVQCPVTIGATLSTLVHVSPKASQPKGCNCSADLRGGFGVDGMASLVLAPEANNIDAEGRFTIGDRGAQDGAEMAKIVNDFWSTDVNPDDYLLVRQALGWNPEIGRYNYSAEGYGDQDAKKGSDLTAERLWSLFD